MIRMLRTAPGSPDGIVVQQYNVGDVYTVPEALGKAFVTDLGWAERFAPSQEALPIAAEKMLGMAPENKRRVIQRRGISGKKRGRKS